MLVLGQVLAPVLIPGLPGCLAAEPSLADCPMRFAVIGDRTGGHIPGRHERAVAEIERLRPEFVVTVGDMIEGYTADSTELTRQWTEYLGIIKPFTMPVYHTPGNHDITEEAMRGAFRRFIGEPFHSFDVRGVHFVVLDNGRFASFDALPGEQVNWLKADLKSHRNAAYTVVFFHVPWWRNGVAAGKPDPLHALFVENGVDAVFSGHYHYYFSGRYDGIIYTGVGTSGAETEGGLTGLEQHFVWVTLDGQGFAISPVRVGAVLPWDEVTVEQDLAVTRLQAEALDMRRVSLGSALTVPQTRITVMLRNLTAFPVRDTMAWDIPEGWTVSPAEAQVDLAPRGDQAFDFVVASGSRVYPAPTVSLRYPYDKDKTFEMRRALPVARTAHAEKASRRPEIDGELDEAIWQAPPVTDLFATDGSAVTADPTAFYFAWDRDNLYLAAKCHECRMDSIVATCTEHDCAIYAEDCVGYFLEPVTTDGPVYQVYFSPSGAVFDQKIDVEHGVSTYSDPKWNGTYEVATSRGADYWLVEARIPLDELGAKAKAGDQWNVNFRRKQRRLATSADWQVPVGYDPVGYGVLELR
jgi:predicted phosphodiesterase